MSNHELSVLFFLQLAVILFAVRMVGSLARKIGQPAVVGEMVAGILLGPSLLGWALPGVQTHLMPAASKPVIYVVCQIGIVLYMFVVGAEFEIDMIRKRFRSALTVSVSGIVVPFALGGGLALWLVRQGIFFNSGIASWQAAMFLGAAMAVTAFPMLARMIRDRGLTSTLVGTLTLAAGAIDDVAAWCLLAVVLACLNGSGAVALLAVGGGLLYVAFVWFIGKPLLARLEARAQKHDKVSGRMLGFVMMLLMLAAWFTDFIGIHAVFGAFVLGVAMPRGVVTRDLQRLIEPVTTNFLLPLFFVYSGLNTRLGLVTPSLFGVTIVIVLAACIGKGAGCWLAARQAGESQRDSLAIGALMNARGLMELIMLNLGLERGIITPALFTVMVVMALATTFMATPLFNLAYAGQRRTLKLPRVTANLEAQAS
ncbi:MAG: cation:proton antiporter [Blastocatellia bacterium]